jgi:hypothetical protein
MTRRGVKLFRQNNATTEIIGELLAKISETVGNSPNPFAQRNIVICLLTGLLGDTVGGKIIPYRKDYDHWIDQLNHNLENETRIEKSREKVNDEAGETRFHCSTHILDHLNHLSPGQEACIEILKKNIIVQRGLGFLNLLDSTYQKIQDVCQPYDSPWFADLLEILLNTVPEVAGKIGLLCYHGKNAEEKDCIFIKIRRAAGETAVDLRAIEEEIQNSFGQQYMGGGGHPGAVSFRIHPQDETEFLSKLYEIIEQLKIFIEQPFYLRESS